MSSEGKEIELNLMQNAIDSLEMAIDLLAWNDQPNQARRLKQAILSAAHGVELLLKARLRHIHPALVWEKVETYPNLSARTVTVDAAITRLINIGGVKFTNEDIALVRALRDKRNSIEHFAWSATASQTYQLVGSALGFAVFFSKAHLGYDFFGYYTKDDDTFIQLMESNPAFEKAYRERNEVVVTKLALEQAKCSFCKAVGVNPQSGLCGICGHMNWNLRSPDYEDDFPF